MTLEDASERIRKAREELRTAEENLAKALRLKIVRKQDEA